MLAHLLAALLSWTVPGWAVSFAVAGAAWATRERRLAQDILREIRSRRHPFLPPEVNVVDGVVLPEPTDPRWRIVRRRLDKHQEEDRRRYSLVARFGPFEVRGLSPMDGLSVSIRGAAVSTGSDEARQYARAVVRAVTDREAQRAIARTS